MQIKSLMQQQQMNQQEIAQRGIAMQDDQKIRRR